MKYCLLKWNTGEVVYVITVTKAVKYLSIHDDMVCALVFAAIFVIILVWLLKTDNYITYILFLYRRIAL